MHLLLLKRFGNNLAGSYQQLYSSIQSIAKLNSMILGTSTMLKLSFTYVDTVLALVTYVTSRGQPQDNPEMCTPERLNFRDTELFFLEQNPPRKSLSESGAYKLVTRLIFGLENEQIWAKSVY